MLAKQQKSIGVRLKNMFSDLRRQKLAAWKTPQHDCKNQYER
jgi:hypothetical protein